MASFDIRRWGNSEMKILLLIVLGLLGLILATVIVAQFGVFSGARPADIGVSDARLKQPSQTRNSVSSQAGLYPDHPQRDSAAIKPLPLKNGDAAASLQAVVAVLEGMPNVRIVEQGTDYVYAQAETRWLKFIDDLEFWVNPSLGVIELRSASRLGREDLGVNRKRIEGWLTKGISLTKP